MNSVTFAMDLELVPCEHRAGPRLSVNVNRDVRRDHELSRNLREQWEDLDWWKPQEMRSVFAMEFADAHRRLHERLVGGLAAFRRSPAWVEALGLRGGIHTAIRSRPGRQRRQVG